MKLFFKYSIVFLSAVLFFPACSKEFKDGESIFIFNHLLMLLDSPPDENKAILPPRIQYPDGPFPYTTGMAIDSLVPELTGKIDSCKSSPRLPDGLSLHPKTCVISGIPVNSKAKATYTITVTNAGGRNHDNIDILIYEGIPTIAYPSGTYIFYLNNPIAPLVPSELTGNPTCSAASLPSGLTLDPNTCVISGTPDTLTSAAVYTITVTNGTGSAAFDINFTVNLAPPTLKYTGSPFTFVTNTPISAVTPSTLTGSPACSVLPSLPSGLTLDPGTCVISGTPTAVTALDTYTITATNGGGSVTFDLDLEVNLAPTVSYTLSSSALCEIQPYLQFQQQRQEPSHPARHLCLPGFPLTMPHAILRELRQKFSLLSPIRLPFPMHLEAAQRR